MHLGVIIDRTTTIRASIHDVEITLMISVIGHPGGVRFPAQRIGRRLIPSVAVPLSLVGTFGVMYLAGTASTIFR